MLVARKVNLHLSLASMSCTCKWQGQPVCLLTHVIRLVRSGRGLQVQVHVSRRDACGAGRWFPVRCVLPAQRGRVAGLR